jgi:hypothetical protein
MVIGGLRRVGNFPKPPGIVKQGFMNPDLVCRRRPPRFHQGRIEFDASPYSSVARRGNQDGIELLFRKQSELREIPGSALGNPMDMEIPLQENGSEEAAAH